LRCAYPESGKAGLNKSVLDAAHGQFIQVLKFVAWKLGKVVKEVDPRGTSQHCWDCLNRVDKELKDRWHSCNCGQELHRDDNLTGRQSRLGGRPGKPCSPQTPLIKRALIAT